MHVCVCNCVWAHIHAPVHMYTQYTFMHLGKWTFVCVCAGVHLLLYWHLLPYTTAPIIKFTKYSFLNPLSARPLLQDSHSHKKERQKKKRSTFVCTLSWERKRERKEKKSEKKRKKKFIEIWLFSYSDWLSLFYTKGFSTPLGPFPEHSKRVSHRTRVQASCPQQCTIPYTGTRS